nr:lipolytic protein [uncultured bacterium]
MSLSLPDVVVESSMLAEGEYKDPASPLMQPIPLPKHCRVRGSIRPAPSSDIKFEVWLPVERWNGKLQGSDNGGFGGTINYVGLALSVNRGYAGVSTDTGHAGSSPEDAAWAKNNPEKVVDFAHRAVHLMTVNAKKIIAAFYGEGPKRSYFAGCSNGGRQGLMSAQRYPEDYDGIIAGAPAHDWTRLMIGFAWNAKALAMPESYIPATLTPVIQEAVNKQCDARDGVVDGVVAEPLSCSFDPEVLLCSADKTEGCLQRPQVEALRAIYRGPHTSAGVRLYPGFPLGAELGNPAPGMGWDGWIFGNGPGDSGHARFAKNLMRYLVTGNERWDVSQFHVDRDAPVIDERLANLMNATDPDLSRFAARGGKLILYHGMADPAIPYETAIEYFDSVGKQMGEAERDRFMRLFLVPGMQHCFGGPGPSRFGGLHAAEQPLDPENDLSAALELWVEQGIAPSTVRAVRPKSFIASLLDMKQAGVERSGLLCAYPKHAKWSGKGDPNDAANYTCAAQGD